MVMNKNGQIGGASTGMFFAIAGALAQVGLPRGSCHQQTTNQQPHGQQQLVAIDIVTRLQQ